MGGVLSSVKSTAGQQGSPKKRFSSSGDAGSPVKESKPAESDPTSVGQENEVIASTEVTASTPPKPDEIIEVSEAEIATIEAASSTRKTKKDGLGYDVVLSPAVKKGPKITPPTSPLSETEIAKKMKEAEDRKLSLDQLKMQNLAAQLDKIKITHQKKEELVAEKSSKAKEVMDSKLAVAEEKRTAQLQEVKDKLSDHLGKIEKAQEKIEVDSMAAKLAAEASLSEKMENHKKKRDEEMEGMLKKIHDHARRAELVRQNKERLMQEVNTTTEDNQTNESA